MRFQADFQLLTHGTFRGNARFIAAIALRAPHVFHTAELEGLFFRLVDMHWQFDSGGLDDIKNMLHKIHVAKNWSSIPGCEDWAWQALWKLFWDSCWQNGEYSIEVTMLRGRLAKLFKILSPYSGIEKLLQNLGMKEFDRESIDHLRDLSLKATKLKATIFERLKKDASAKEEEQELIQDLQTLDFLDQAAALNGDLKVFEWAVLTGKESLLGALHEANPNLYKDGLRRILWLCSDEFPISWRYDFPFPGETPEQLDERLTKAASFVMDKLSPEDVVGGDGFHTAAYLGFASILPKFLQTAREYYKNDADGFQTWLLSKADVVGKFKSALGLALKNNTSRRQTQISGGRWFLPIVDAISDDTLKDEKNTEDFRHILHKDDEGRLRTAFALRAPDLFHPKELKYHFYDLVQSHQEFENGGLDDIQEMLNKFHNSDDLGKTREVEDWVWNALWNVLRDKELEHGRGTNTKEIRERFAKVFKMLLGYVDVAKRNDEDFDTLLHVAAEKGYNSLVEVIIDHVEKKLADNQNLTKKIKEILQSPEPFTQILDFTDWVQKAFQELRKRKVIEFSNNERPSLNSAKTKLFKLNNDYAEVITTFAVRAPGLFSEKDLEQHFFFIAEDGNNEMVKRMLESVPQADGWRKEALAFMSKSTLSKTQEAFREAQLKQAESLAPSKCEYLQEIAKECLQAANLVGDYDKLRKLLSESSGF